MSGSSSEADGARQVRLPDFIIGGAPKCGTTSLHFILDQHPDIGMPRNEVFYFDADDPIVHPDFLFVDKGNLRWWDPEANEGTDALDWYGDRFADVARHPLVGEDSTTYLTSEVAPQRIQTLLPEVRMVFMLRHPVRRTYSQYWHLMKTGRATRSFERTLIENRTLLLGSTYAPHLKRFMDVMGPQRVHVVLFEEFLADMQSVVNRVTDFLGASRMTLEPGRTWFNKTYYPTNLRGQLLLNRVGSRIVRSRYHNHMGLRNRRFDRIRNKLHYRWFKWINPILLKAERPPLMAPETEAYLTRHLAARNRGLSELLGRNVGDLWGKAFAHL